MTATFELEDTLPTLPLPDLNSTFEQLEESIKPLNVADGYHRPLRCVENGYKLYKAVSTFLVSEAAQKLQTKLQELNHKGSHQLDDLQLDIYNHSLTREVEGDVLPRNPFLLLAEDADENISQHDRAAVLCYSALKFISALRHNVLEPDKGPSGEPLTMKPYTDLFATTRCPALLPIDIQNLDETLPFEHPENEGLDHSSITKENFPGSKHVIVISRGQYYAVDVLDEADCPLYDDTTMSHVLEAIVADSLKDEHLHQATAVGSFTAYSLRRWKHARGILKKKCHDQLLAVDSALFTLILDESSPTQSESVECERFFYGTSATDDKSGRQVGSCCSRWYDKLQLIITKDAKAAIIWDSFTCDGSAVLRFASDIYADSVLRLAREINEDPLFSLWPAQAVKGGPKPRAPKKIEWNFCNTLKNSILMSETSLIDLICRHEVVHKNIPYGIRIAHTLGIHSDSMIQVAIQIAHYVLYGKMTFTFEPISTRSFRNSRSSFLPIQSQSLSELCQLFSSSLLDKRSKLARFVMACEKHRQNVIFSRSGKGFEKHYNTLKYLYQNYKQFNLELSETDLKVSSAVFENQLLDPISSPEIIAAHCGSSATIGFGINPPVSQGFGIGYSLDLDRCDLTITSQFKQGKRFLLALKWVLDELVCCLPYRENANSALHLEGTKVLASTADMFRQMKSCGDDSTLANELIHCKDAVSAWGDSNTEDYTESTTNSEISSSPTDRSRSKRKGSVTTTEFTEISIKCEDRRRIGREIFLANTTPLPPPLQDFNSW
ncbi:LADA_0A00738g1_1 [Lachancea dasiensis]|uniref:LADA_0A00738g1_1 n=1 Tax=Lachancea dasiensis TaxID=1072105 RepID=A0A1G4ILT3_9SACH|nr:LADA_0A00738g1_1 [Lachancea dasiensis]